MMSRKKSLALLSTLAVGISLADTAASAQAAAEISTENSAASNSTIKKQAAIDLARQQLSKQKDIDPYTFKIISVEDYTWPDSSLGCGRNGQMAAQVITPGYIITIQSGKGTHVVHATSKHAVICADNITLRNPHAVNAPLRNLDEMITKARDDLAGRLHANQELIRTVTFIAAEWPDTSMACNIEGETVEHKTTKGYRIALNYRGRTFIYHTDLQHVRPCPAIEAQ